MSITGNPPTTRLTSKGQVTVPKHVRDELRLKPGDEVEFVEEDGHIRIRKHFDREAFEKALDKWTGVIDLGNKSVDELIDEMRGE